MYFAVRKKQDISAISGFKAGILMNAGFFAFLCGCFEAAFFKPKIHPTAVRFSTSLSIFFCIVFSLFA